MSLSLTPQKIDEFVEGIFNTFAGSTRSRSNTKKLIPAIEEDFISQLILTCREVVMSQPILLELEAPIKICGDIHAQLADLVRLFTTCGMPPASNYLFLGDYVDRGKYGVETMCLLMSFKVRYPENFFLLRGNHESSSITRLYGFYDECKRKYIKNGMKIWRQFCDFFNCLPVCAIVDEKIFCAHGGLSPELLSSSDFKILKKTLRPYEIGDSGMICDLLWSDPDESLVGWCENESRGVSYCFGRDRIEQFLKRNEFDLIVRAHQVVQDGYAFAASRQLVTVFSAPNYCNEFDNSGAIMSVDADLMCSFTILKPKY